MGNLLLERIEYKVEHTGRGTWRRYVYPNGSYFAEFRSHGTWLGLPLLHYTRGRSPETGRWVVARGIIAVGRGAMGGLAIGQASAGIVALGQASIGVLLGLAQATGGLIAVGQLAVGLDFGLGQAATGQTVIAQFGFGEYVLAQFGFGEFLWTSERADPEAVAYFQGLWVTLKDWF